MAYYLCCRKTLNMCDLCDFWWPLVIFDDFWCLLMIFGNFWWLWAIFGEFGSHLRPNDLVWFLLTLGYFRSLQIASNHFRSLQINSFHFKSLEMITGDSWWLTFKSRSACKVEVHNGQYVWQNLSMKSPIFPQMWTFGKLLDIIRSKRQ